MKEITPEQIKDLIVSTFDGMNEGIHSWLELGDNKFLVIEPESDGEADYLSIYVTDKLDSLNYGNGEILFNGGLAETIEDAEPIIDELMTYIAEQEIPAEQEIETDMVQSAENVTYESKKVTGTKFDTLFESVMTKVGAKK